MEWDVNLVCQALVQTTEQCTATREPDTVLHNISVKLWWSILKGREHGILNLSHGLVQAVSNLLIAYWNLHWEGCDTVRTMNDEVLWSLLTQVCQGRTYVNLDTLSHTLRNLHVVLTAHVLLDFSGEVVTGCADRVVGNDTTERNNGNLGRTTTYINYHIAFRCLHIDTDTDSGSHRLKNQINVATVGMLGRVTNGTELHLGRARRNTNHHAE